MSSERQDWPVQPSQHMYAANMQPLGVTAAYRRALKCHVRGNLSLFGLLGAGVCCSQGQKRKKP